MRIGSEKLRTLDPKLNTNGQSDNLWLSMAEASKHTPYSAEYLSLIARKGKLPAKKINGAWYTTKTILGEYMKEQMLRVQAQKKNLNGSEASVDQVSAGKTLGDALPATPSIVLKKVRSFHGDVSEYERERNAQLQSNTTQVTKPVHSSHLSDIEQALEKVIDQKFFTKKAKAEKSESPHRTHPVHVPQHKFAYKRMTAFVLVSILLLTLSPVPFVFGAFQKSFDSFKESLNDANTVMGFRPGTHANQLLLLDKNGNIAIAGRLESGVEDGVAPIVVESKTLVKNLNADYLDDLQALDFTLAYVTKNGSVTTEDVRLEGSVAVGEALQVRGATRLASSLTVDGRISALGNAEFNAILRVLGPAHFEGIVSVLKDMTVKGNLSTDGDLSVGKNITVRGSITSDRSIVGKTGSFQRGSISGELTAGEITSPLATLTEIISDDISVGALTFTTAVGTSATTTNLYSSNLTGTNFLFTNATGTSATTTNFFSSNGGFTTLSVTGDASVTGNFTVGGDTTTIGQLLSTRVPTLAHVFSPWPSGGTSNASDATIYINPATAATDTNIFAAAVGGVVKFLIDAEGDVYANNMILAGSVSQGETNIAGNLNVQDSTTLGDSSSDITTLNSQLLVLASTSLQNFTFVNATGTSATTTNLYFSNNLTGPGNFVVNSGGNVGIGTMTPARKLHVKSSDAVTASFEGVDDGLAIYNGTAGQIDLIGYQDSSNTYNSINIRTGLAATNGIFINSSGNVGIGTTNPLNKLHVKIGTDLNWQFGYPTDTSTSLAALNDTNSAYVDARIDGLTLSLNSQSGGNVGIGDTTPTNKLDVAGTIGISDTTVIDASRNLVNIGTITSGLINGQTISSAANFTGTVAVATSLATPSIITASGALGITPAAGSNLNINLSTTGDFAVNTNQFYVDTSAGNVGIGTAIPSGKLHVAGGVAIFDNPGGNARVLGTAGTLGGNDLGIYASDANTFSLSAWDSQTRGITIKTATGNIGIGTNNPTTGKLQVMGSANTWTSYLQANGTSGQSYGLLIDAGTTSGDEPFRIRNAAGSSELFMVKGNGFVGINNASPSTYLHVGGTTDTAVGTHGLMVLGPANSENISIDQNEIMARNNGAVSPLYLNADGGLVNIGSGGLSIGTGGLSTTGAVSSPLFIGSSAASSNYRRINNPGGAEYVTTSDTVTGAIAITMPVWTPGMYKMKIEVYEYSTNESFTLEVGGHNSDVNWYNEFAYITANPGTDRRFNVRFGRTAGGLPVIYIGELGSTWSYPQVYVTEFQHGYSGNSASFASGWSIGFETGAFAGVSRTQSLAQIGYAVSTNTANSTVLRDASGNFSAGTINTDGGYQIGGVNRLMAQTNYTTLRNSDGNIAMYLGGADPSNYYDNTTHYFRSANGGGTTFLTLNASTAAFNGTITGGTYNGQTISSAANFTGTLTAATSLSSADIYASSWFRNDGLKEGLYNSASAKHFYSESTAYWAMDSTNGMIFRNGHDGPVQGYVYNDATGFGLLNNLGNWMLYSVDGSQLVTFPGGLSTSGIIRRDAAGAGYLNGNYPNSESTVTSGAIYSIGGQYVPGTTNLGNMYGIGFGYSGNAGITATNAPASNWGMYVASNGTSRIFMSGDTGNVYINGSYNGASLTTSGLITGGTVRSNTNVYTDQNYGYGLVGAYDSARYQGVFAMGDSYKLPADGTSPGSLYGIAWTHTNVGGQSKSGLGHQALFMSNGTTQTAIGTGIWTNGVITGLSSLAISGNSTLSGRVGIGRSPNYKLDVVNDVGNDWTVVANQNGTSGYGILGYGSTYAIYGSGPIAGSGTITAGSTITASGSITNSAPSQGNIELSGLLPGYADNTYPTLKTSGSVLYFSAGGVYSGYWSGNNLYSNGGGFYGAGTGLTGTAASLTAGSANAVSFNSGLTTGSSPSFQNIYVAGSGQFDSLFVGGYGGMTYNTCDMFDSVGGIITNCAGFSDERLKTNIVGLSANGPVMDKIMAIQGVTYEFNELYYENNPQARRTGEQIGFVAQEVQPFFPEVMTENDGYLGLMYSKMVAILWEGVKETYVRVDGNTVAIAALDERVTQIELDWDQASSSLSISTSTPGFVASVLETMKATVVDGVTHFVKLAVENLAANALTIGKREAPTGITIYDEATGEPFCLKIRNGNTTTTAGECGTVTAPTGPIIEIISGSSEPEPEPTATSTVTTTPNQTSSEVGTGQATSTEAMTDTSTSTSTTATTTEPTLEPEPEPTLDPEPAPPPAPEQTP